MKPILLFAFSICCLIAFPQKYVLLDKKMSIPVSYANDISVEQAYKGIFPVEKINIKKFIAAVEKISKLLAIKNAKPNPINFRLGATKFSSVKISSKAEERVDIVITTFYNNTNISMHLADARNSNANNAYYINTWLKYIKGYIK